MLLPKDYVRLWLSGDHASDMSDSAGTSWLDVAKRDWSDDLLAATHLHRDQMPTLYEGTEPTGKLRARARQPLGHDGARRSIAGGAGDNAASACGVGTVAPGSAFVSLGTSGRALRLQRKVPAERGERRARLLPRAAEHLAPDGRHPLGRRLARMAGRRDRRERRRARRASVEGAAGGPGSRCSSSPTSPASARRTTTPRRAAASSACRTRPTARRWRAR